jgi:cellulose biosynthesis protein BcsQ
MDFDPQSNLTQRLGLSDTEFKDRRLNQFFKYADTEEFDESHMNLPLIIRYPYFYRVQGTATKAGKVAILPGSGLAAMEAASTYHKLVADRYNREDTRDLYQKFEDSLQQYKRYYDFVFIDTAPAIEGNILCQLAVRAADEIVCPVDGLEAALGLKHFINWANIETYHLREQKKKRPNMLFTMVKYQDDTKEYKDLIEESNEEQIKNVVYRALKSNLGEFVCENGIQERQSMRNTVYGGFGRKNVYEDLCGEILTRISIPRPNIFDFAPNAISGLQADLKKIDVQALKTRRPTFLAPKYISEVIQNAR